MRTKYNHMATQDEKREPTLYRDDANLNVSGEAIEEKCRAHV